MHEHIFSAYLLREEDDVPVVQHRRGKPSQPLERPEVLGHGQSGVAEAHGPGLRAVLVRLRIAHLVVGECPVASRRIWAESVGHIEELPEFHYPGILDAASVRSVSARSEDRPVRHPGEMEAVLALRKTEPDDMVLVVAGGPVEHSELSSVIYHSRVACHEVLPRIVRIGRDDRVTFEFLEFHSSIKALSLQVPC